jgi:nitroreductase
MDNLTLDDIKQRHSVRSFTNEELAPSVISALESEINYVNTHVSGMKFQLILNDPAPFSGINNSYGMFRNAHHYLACVVDTSFKDLEEKSGYCAQQIVIRAVKLGLGACFVSGTFNRQKITARIRPGEKLLFVVLLGYPEESKTRLIARISSKLMHKSSTPPDSLFIGDGISYDEAIKQMPLLKYGLEAVSLAPSAMNRKPVRISVINHRTSLEIRAITVEHSAQSKIDLGIAKFNFQVPFPGEWEWREDGEFYPLQINA